MSPSATADAADTFAQRLVAEIDAAKISWQGQSLKIRASIGACDSVAESVESFADLMVIALQRMLQAREAGGGRVVARGTNGPAIAPARAIPSIDDALAMLADGNAERLKPFVAELARRIYPLVRFCDDVFEGDVNTSAEIRVHRVIEKAKKLENEE